MLVSVKFVAHFAASGYSTESHPSGLTLRASLMQISLQQTDVKLLPPLHGEKVKKAGTRWEQREVKQSAGHSLEVFITQSPIFGID